MLIGIGSWEKVLKCYFGVEKLDFMCNPVKSYNIQYNEILLIIFLSFEISFTLQEKIPITAPLKWCTVYAKKNVVLGYICVFISILPSLLQIFPKI